jgi:hypothetical protein
VARSSTAAPKHTSKPGSQLRSNAGWSCAVLPLRAWVVDRHFLQAQHVEVGHRTRVLHHAGHVDAAVQAAEPLHIPGDQFHVRFT